MLIRRSPPRRSALAPLLTAALVTVTACSGESEPPVFEAADLVEVAALTATPVERWGTGVAVAAHPLPDGRSAVITAAGIYVDDGSDDPTEVDVFGGSTDVQLSAVSDDGSTLVISTSSPPTLRWYDLTGDSDATSVELGADLAVSEIEFRGGSTTLVAITPSGVVSWDAAAPAAAPTLLHAAPVGPIVAVGDRIIAPAFDASELIVIDGVSAERRPVDIAADARPVTARAAPGLDVLGVAAGAATNEFGRFDTVHVLDATTFAAIGAVTFDGPRPLEWAMADTAVAVADGPALSIFSFDGQPLLETTPLPDDPILSIESTSRGVTTVHLSGTIVSWAAPDWLPTTLAESDTTLRFVAARGDVVTAVDGIGRITRWNLADGTRTDQSRFATGEATALAIDTRGDRLAVATTSGQVILLDGDLSQKATLVLDGLPEVGTVEFHPTDPIVVTGLDVELGPITFDDTVTLWEVDSLQPTVTFGGESEEVPGCTFFESRVGFTPDGELMSAVSHDFTIEIHDGGTGDYIVTLPPFSSTVLDTDFSVTGDILAASADDSSVRIWDTEDFEELASYPGPPGGLQAIELLPDDESMVATDLNGRLLLLDLLTGEELIVFAELGRRTTAIGLSHDGGVAAAPMPDGSIGLWSTTSGALLTTVAGHASTVTDVEFAPDDRSMYSSSRDGTVLRWDLDITEG